MSIPFFKVKLALLLNYFVFAILLNSVGIVILQMIRLNGVAEGDAAVLEAYKDLPIAICSFLIASLLPRLGYRRAMGLGLLIVSAATSAMAASGGGFWMAKLLFVAIGVSFALVKVSVYSTVGLITEDARGHVSFMSTLEGVFQVGVLAGYWIFSLFMSDDPAGWLRTYYLVSAMALCAFLLLSVTPLDESAARSNRCSVGADVLAMLRLLSHGMVLLFILCAFLYVFVEQGIQTWLPTFNNKILHLPESMSIQVTSILAATIAAGRILGGFVMQRIQWHKVLMTCLAAAIALVLLVLPLAQGIEPGAVTGWGDVPSAALLLPLIGLFIGPVYPTLCSIVLSYLPKPSQSAMTGLIVIFSALGGTIGSRITGEVFGRLSGVTAFYVSLLPMALLLTALLPYRRLQVRSAAALKAAPAKE